MGVSVNCVINAQPRAAFDLFVEELTSAVAARGIQFISGLGGSLTKDGQEIARVVEWEPERGFVLEWKRPDWKKEAKATTVRVSFLPEEGGTRVSLGNSSWGRALDDEGSELAGWFAGEIAGPFLLAMSSDRFGDWITDRRARRPSGEKARYSYRNPIHHRPNFLAILDFLRLTPEDYLIEIGCGGGAFLKDALTSGCKAAAVDHSYDMVNLARAVNHDSVAAGHLVVRESEADSLPFDDETFTCAVMTGVFGFLPDPRKALAEISRVLTQNGRLVLFTGTKELRGTPAAPEPVASRLKFYEDFELQQLARQAGFKSSRVEHPSLLEYARKSDVPKEDISLFSGREGQFLIAEKN
jgi:ubiquinone/menaquinone biosynthesis C-methylase UbiE